MPRIATWISVAATTAALLVGGLSAAPASADVPSGSDPTTINLRYAAAESTVTVTGASTVADAITELNLEVDGDDRVSPRRDAKVTDGMSLVIDVVSVTTTTTKQTVRYKTVKVGTSRLNLARWKKWNKIARCESGGRWHLNTHNGYYGGLQFSRSTWRSAGGRKFATYPHRASKREQIHVANTLHAKRGFRPWSCRP